MGINKHLIALGALTYSQRYTTEVADMIQSILQLQKRIQDGSVNYVKDLDRSRHTFVANSTNWELENRVKRYANARMSRAQARQDTQRQTWVRCRVRVTRLYFESVFPARQ